jgi:sulfide:quinone oxidoreductase
VTDRALVLSSGRTVPADRVLAMPQLEGPWVTGLPGDDTGFIEIDARARVIGLEDVYAAGDATNYPIKQGGIATQLADLAVDGIAARMHGTPPPPEFRPVLRGMLLTGVAPTYLQATIGGEARLLDQLSASPLWWPPTKVAGRHLGPYLARALGEHEIPEAEASAWPGRGDVSVRHGQARELALSFALADANNQDYWSALRWLDVVELLDGVLPPDFERKRAEWLTGTPARRCAGR